MKILCCFFDGCGKTTGFQIRSQPNISDMKILLRFFSSEKKNFCS